jgi:hypothetical protein
MNAKIRAYFVAFLCGIVLGAGIVGGFWIYRSGQDAATHRAVVAAYQSSLADWQRRATELSGQLADAERDAHRSTELAARLNELVARNAGFITAARSENERAIAQLRLAIAVYDILREYYDPSYGADAKTGKSSKY